MDKLPLRERKKIQTRQRILQAAEDLTNNNDYEAVTIAAICDRAEIAQRTFFSYFPSKEAVFFYDKQCMLVDLAEKLTDRPEGKTTFQVMREVIAVTIDKNFSDSKKAPINEHFDAVLHNQQLQMYGDYLNHRFEEILRKSIARDLNEDVDALGPTLAASSVNSTLEAIFKQYGNSSKITSKKAVVEILDKTLSFLEAGIGALDSSKKSSANKK
jgi:AcrR family transcriptional regulator